jgi:hypothetical protein
MSRHARETHIPLTLIEPGPPREPPYRPAPEPDPDDEELPDEAAETQENQAKPDLYDYELINWREAEAKHGPFHGSPVMISDDIGAPGVLAVWYVTRQRIGFTWQRTSKWIDPFTRVEIEMKPKFWRANPRMGAFF